MTDEEMLAKMRVMARHVHVFDPKRNLSGKARADRFRQSCWNELCDLAEAALETEIGVGPDDYGLENALAALKAKVEKL